MRKPTYTKVVRRSYQPQPVFGKGKAFSVFVIVGVSLILILCAIGYWVSHFPERTKGTAEAAIENAKPYIIRKLHRVEEAEQLTFEHVTAVSRSDVWYISGYVSFRDLRSEKENKRFFSLDMGLDSGEWVASRLNLGN